MKKRFFLLTFIFYFLSTVISHAYQWPLRNNAGSHAEPFPINGTLGEYRSGHLHDGVDIQASKGKDVYPVATGTVSPIAEDDDVFEKRGTANEYIRIGNFVYVHISIDNRTWEQLTTKNRSVTFTAYSTVIGETNSLNHLHFSEGNNGAEVNPLRKNGLSNYKDTDRTYVYSPKFYIDDTTTGLTDQNEQGRIVLSGKVDILAKAKDDQSLGSDTVAPYLVGYLVKDAESKVVIDKANITFDNLNNAQLDKIYHTTLSNSSEYHYWVTNQKNANDAWDTTSLPDGEYNISVYADDVKGVESGNHKYNIATSKGAETITVLIDNNLNVESTIPEDGSFNIPTESKQLITIKFDREMNTTDPDQNSASNSIITFDPSDFTYKSVWTNNKTLTITPDSPLTPNTDYKVIVSDIAKDKDENQLDGDEDGEPGGDYSFGFSTKKATLEIKIEPALVVVDGEKWAKSGAKTVVASLVDIAGNVIESTMAPSVVWVGPAGQTQEISFPSSSTPTSSWTATLNIPEGNDGPSSFTSDMDTTGDVSFNLDTTPPKLEPGSVFSRSCACPRGPVAFDYKVDDGSGSGVGLVDLVGLGLSTNGCYAPGDYEYGAKKITDKVGNEMSLTGTIGIINNKCTNPDDNYSVVVRSIEGGTTPPDAINGGNVGILGGGYVYPAQKFLIDKIGLNTDIISPNFSPDIYEEYPLLIIPTGALSGLTQSDSFKARLASYVENGGTIFALSQMQGYEFGALPGGDVEGYGYQNDQQCFTNAANIDTWHQVLSGQSESNLDLNMDGFYTGIPATGDSLLKRVSNGQTALTIYPYGKGNVIATTLYTDWGYSVSQYTQDEISLIRDIVAWAKNPKELPETKPGGSVSAALQVVNSSEQIVNDIKVFIRNPEKDIVKEFIVPVNINPGGVAEVNVTYESDITSPLGIWWVNYELLVESGETLFPEHEGARFAIASHPQTPAEETGLKFSLISESENYLRGSMGKFTIMAFNEGNVERTIIAEVKGKKEKMLIPAKGSSSFNYEQLMSQDSLRGMLLTAYFYDEEGNGLGRATKRYWTTYPGATASVETNKYYYSMGEDVNITAKIYNQIRLNWSPLVIVKLIDRSGNLIHSQEYNVDLDGYGVNTKSLNFSLPQALGIASYSVVAEVRYLNYLRSKSSTNIYIPKSYLSTTHDLPQTIASGGGLSTLNLLNRGLVSVSSGVVAIKLKSPYGEEIYSESATFDLPIGENKTFDFHASLPPLKFGDYILSSTTSDETGTGRPYDVVIPNDAVINIEFDKDTYRIRERANANVKVKNVGRFALEGMTLTVDVPDAGFSGSQTVYLYNAEDFGLFSFAIPLPENMTVGQHDVNVTLALPSGSALKQSTKFTIPDSSLNVEYAGPANVKAGESVLIEIENSGGVDTTASVSVQLVDFNDIAVDSNSSSSIPVQADNKNAYSFKMPSDIAAGDYKLLFSAIDANNSATAKSGAYLNMNGVGASLLANTNKDYYLATDDVNLQVELHNSEFPIDGENLNTKIIKTVPGEKWKTITESNSTTTFAGLNVKWVIADNSNNKWISFYENAEIAKFDGTTWTRYDASNSGIPANTSIGTAEIDSNGNLWVMAGKAVVKYDGTTWARFEIPDTIQGDSQWWGVEKIAIEDNGTLWLATSGAGILKFDGERWTVYNTSNSNLETNRIYSVAVDSKGNKWFVTHGYGVYRFDGSNWEKFTKDTTGNAIPANYIVSIYCDHDGGVYVNSTWGIGRYKDGLWERFFDGYGGGRAYRHPFVQMIDKDNNIWIRHNYTKHLYKTDTSGNILESYSLEDRDGVDISRTMVEDLEGSLWFGADSGLGSFDGSSWARYESNGLPDDNIIASFYDKSGNMWFGHYRHVSHYNGSEWKTYKMPTPGHIHDIVQDNEGNMWFAADNAGALKLDIAGKWTVYKENNSGIADNLILSIYLDREGKIWFGGYFNGLSVYDGNTWHYYNTTNSGLHDNRINSIAEDKNGNMWFGTVQGTSMFDGENWFKDAFRLRRQSDDLPPVRKMKMDREGNLWAYLHMGSPMVKFDGNEWTYVNGTHIPYLSDFDFDANNTLWVSTSHYGLRKLTDNGMEVFMPSNSDIPSKYLEALEIDDKGQLWIGSRHDGVIVHNADATAVDKVVYDKDLSINLSANETFSYNENLGALPDAGKYYLTSDLTNRYGQTVSSSDYVFYVVKDNILLKLTSDKDTYKPGETITIEGELVNVTGLSVSGLAIQFTAAEQNIYSETVDLPANGNYLFTATKAADNAGTITVTGTVSHNDVKLVDIMENYEVSVPTLGISISAPDLVGKEVFEFDIELKNDGKVDSSVQLSLISGQDNNIDDQQLTVPAGETKLLEYTQKIDSNTVYTVNISGEITESATKSVRYGEEAQIQLGVANNESDVQPEGTLEIPVTITNIGQIDETVEVSYRLADTSNNSIAEETRTYYLAVGSSATDSLHFDLEKGDYQLSAISYQPDVSAQTSIKIVTIDDAEMTVTARDASATLLPVTVNIINNGWNSIDGSIDISVQDNNGVVKWSSKKEIAGLPSRESGSYEVNVNTETLDTGINKLQIILYNNAGQEIAAANGTITIAGPEFEVTALPGYQTFKTGEEGTFIFKVKNIGDQSGEMNFKLSVMDVLDQNKTEWIKPDEEKVLSFSFVTPDDLEENDYFADYELKKTERQESEGSRGQIKFHVEGINIDVGAMLDQEAYIVGDTAVFNITVTNNSQVAEGIKLFARTSYAGHDEQKPFMLNGTNVLTFNVPITQIGEGKLFYGIYHEGGRSVYLNTLYIHQAGELVTIRTDKQVYEAGESITVSISGLGNGQMTLMGPGNYTETFNFSGNAAKSIRLPSMMSAGTYYIDYELVTENDKFSGNYKIDVKGIEVKILETALSKGKYAAVDTIHANLKIYSNKKMPSLLKTFIVDPNGNYIDAGSELINLTSAEPLMVTLSSDLNTDKMGIHQFVYRIYTEDGNLILASGSEYFDVGEAQLIGLSIDKAEYPTLNEPIKVSLNMYGTTDAIVGLYVDNQMLSQETVVLDGFDKKEISLDLASNILPGTRTLRVTVTAGGLTSSKEIEFVIGSSLPDLIVNAFTMESTESIQAILAATVTNQGKTTSQPSSVTFYDGDPERSGTIIGDVAVPALEPDESETFTFNWNLMGHAGAHSIFAVVGESVASLEFDSSNNVSSASIEVPDIGLSVKTDADNYEANQHVSIIENVLNLTTRTTYNDVVLSTEIKDQTGNSVESFTNDIGSFNPGELSYTNLWNTASSYAGYYTVDLTLKRQNEQPPIPPGCPPPEFCIPYPGCPVAPHCGPLPGGFPPMNSPQPPVSPIEYEVLAEASTFFEILPTVSANGEITLSSDEVIQGLSLEINYNITNNGNTDISGGSLIVNATNKQSSKATPLSTTTLDYLGLSEATSGSISIESVDVEPGDYTVSLELSVDGKLIEIASKDLAIKPSLKVTKTISTLPRVLVWIAKDNSNNHGSSLQQTESEIIAHTALQSIGAYYKIVHTQSEFIEGMRSDYYNTYALLDTGGPTTGSLASELVERTWGGDTLILTNRSNIDDIKVSEVTGTKYVGIMNNAVGTVTSGLPIYNEPEDITISGKVQKLEILGGNVEIVGTIQDKGKEYPSLTFNKYGEGQAALIAFDIEESAKATNHTVTYAELLRRVIDYTSPAETDITAATVVPVEVVVESLGSVFDLKIEEIAGGGMIILEANNNGIIDSLSNKVTWNIHLEESQVKRLVYLAALPEYSSISQTDTDVYYLNNEIEQFYNSYMLNVYLAEGVVDIQNRILSALNGLLVTKQERGARDSILRDFERITVTPSTTRKDIEKDIHELVMLIGGLDKLSVDTREIKLDIGDMIVILERRWAITN